MRSYKLLKGVAHNIGDSMVSGLGHDGEARLPEHLSFAALRAGAPRVELDLAAGTVGPAAAATAALSGYATRYQLLLPRYLSGMRASLALVRSVVMAAEFNLGQRVGLPELGGEGAALRSLTVTIVDDRGKAFEAPINPYWEPPEASAL